MAVLQVLLCFTLDIMQQVPASWRIAVAGRPLAPTDAGGLSSWDDDAVCHVCFDGHSTDGNPVVFCDNCDIALHQVPLFLW